MSRTCEVEDVGFFALKGTLMNGLAAVYADFQTLWVSLVQQAEQAIAITIATKLTLNCPEAILQQSCHAD